jgi:uncharacterized protein YwgA
MSQNEKAAGNLIIITQLKGGMLGKLDFQKTVYLAMQIGVDLPFNFKWDKLGPYSFELSYFGNQLLARDVLCIKSGKYEVNRHSKDISRLQRIATIDAETTRRLKSFFDSIRKAVHKGKFSIPLFMECLGSLKFLKESRGFEKSQAIQTLQRLKPDKANDFAPMMESAWDLLIANNL